MDVKSDRANLEIREADDIASAFDERSCRGALRLRRRTPLPSGCGLWGQFRMPVACILGSRSYRFEVLPLSRWTPNGRLTMSVVDPFEKAADCARAIQISTDPVRKDILHNLQQMWIACSRCGSPLRLKKLK